MPVAAYAEVDARDRVSDIRLTGLVISEDGKKAIQVNRAGVDAQLLGNELAKRAIAQGANEILALRVMQ